METNYGHEQNIVPSTQIHLYYMKSPKSSKPCDMWVLY